LLCEYAISEVDKLIEDKKNEEEIKSVLDKICYELRFVSPPGLQCDWKSEKILPNVLKRNSCYGKEFGQLFGFLGRYRQNHQGTPTEGEGSVQLTSSLG
jgi:hypothetical protein